MRFAVLAHHCGPLDRPDHYDVLFEQPGRGLMTWQIRRPFFRSGWQPAKRLADHRPVYLDYQGLIVGRGWIERIAEGRFQALAHDAQTFRALLRTEHRSAVAEFAWKKGSDVARLIVSCHSA
jgi:hypothetical protein